MKICLLAALNEEIKPVVEKLQFRGPTPLGFTLRWQRADTILVKTGVGKVNAAAVTQLTIDREKPDVIINFGFTGGFKGKVSIGDIVIPHQVIQYDNDQRKLGGKLGQVPNINKVRLPLAGVRLREVSYKRGVCLTADKILSNKKEARQLVKSFHPTVVDMELGAIVQVSYLNKVKLLSVKSPADIVEEENVHTFTDNIAQCSQSITTALKEVLTVLEAM